MMPHNVSLACACVCVCVCFCVCVSVCVRVCLFIGFVRDAWNTLCSDDAAYCFIGVLLLYIVCWRDACNTLCCADGTCCSVCSRHQRNYLFTPEKVFLSMPFLETMQAGQRNMNEL